MYILEELTSQSFCNDNIEDKRCHRLTAPVRRSGRRSLPFRSCRRSFSTTSSSIAPCIKKVAHQLRSSEVSHSGCQPLVAGCSFQINKFHLGIVWAIWIIIYLLFLIKQGGKIRLKGRHQVLRRNAIAWMEILQLRCDICDNMWLLRHSIWGRI